ncbi:antibiotic biosynthesis monooxygenase [Ornithinimicrobium cryptoxanthini]|uniref:antibiotic biosynthesis monooxygenase n=1 Tax=Ornithinimicrobium cryptoxanthini TaxID=2934161 RepID=UPI0021181AF8|nr:antibiotic biosynthesis monooxygenase [Ornithinimicrobium cryptoxanthini]
MSQSDHSQTGVTRIARRKVRPGHESAYEELVREMFVLMKRHQGFLGADIIPPEPDSSVYQVVVNFGSEGGLAEWDASADRREIFARMRAHAEGEPEHRRLNALEEWFVGPSVPEHTRPPRWKTAVVTWLGIWPLASVILYFLTPLWDRLGLPFLVMTAINVVLIVGAMVYLVAPVLTKLMKGFLVGRPQG